MGVGHDGGCRERPTVAQLVDRKLGGIHGIEHHGAHRTVFLHVIGRCHVARRYGMEHGCHADDGRSVLDEAVHGVLRGIGIPDDLGQRAVITYGASEHVRHAAALERAHDAVIKPVVSDELPDGSGAAHLVDDVHVVVMPARLRHLRIDVLAKRRVQKRAFEVVRRKGVATHEAVGVAGVDDGTHGRASLAVKREGRSRDPQDVAVIAFVGEQLNQLVVVACVGGLTASSLTEGKLVLSALPCRGKTVRPHEDTFLATLLSPYRDKVTNLEFARRKHLERSVGAQANHVIHHHVRREHPDAVHPEVLRVHRGAVKAAWSYAVALDRYEPRVRRAGQRLDGKVWLTIRSHQE